MAYPKSWKKMIIRKALERRCGIATFAKTYRINERTIVRWLKEHREGRQLASKSIIQPEAKMYKRYAEILKIRGFITEDEYQEIKKKIINNWRFR